MADLAGVDGPVVGAGDKAALHRKTGAVAADMESHVAARLAALHGLPFAAIRVVADPAGRTLPPAALVGMRPDGATDIASVLRALGRAPGQLPALIRTGLDARAAFAALKACRRGLSGLYGLGGLRPEQSVDAHPGPPRDPNTAPFGVEAPAG